MEFVPHPYQVDAMGAMWDATHTGDQAIGVLLDPGSGKTPMTLDLIKKLQAEGRGACLVVAPLRVIYSVWRQEAAKWDQFKDLTFSLVHGYPAKRLEALEEDANIYLMTPDCLDWLLTTEWRPDILILDESSKFKNWTAKRTKALRKIAPECSVRVLLTGTIRSNHLMDLFPQVWALDFGQRLGRNITQFRSKYFRQGGFKGYEWIPHEHAQTAIEAKIHDVVYRLDTRPHLNLPPLVTNNVYCDLPKTMMKAYRKLEQDMMLEWEEEQQVFTSTGQKFNACRQFLQGAVYDGPGSHKFTEIHDLKFDALEDIREELGDKPILLAYQYRSDLERILERYPNTPHIGGGVGPKEADALVVLWNKGKLPLLAAQPQSLSHGVNMQGGGNDLVWFGLTTSLEIYLQLVARLYRQGVVGTVRVHRILIRRTLDEVLAERIDAREMELAGMMQRLKELREKFSNSPEFLTNWAGF